MPYSLGVCFLCYSGGPYSHTPLLKVTAEAGRFAGLKGQLKQILVDLVGAAEGDLRELLGLAGQVLVETCTTKSPQLRSMTNLAKSESSTC